MLKRKTAKSSGLATIRDVARESGVSVATVSYVLNDGPRKVATETRERVLQTVRRLSYHPNATAQRLAGRTMRTVGVLFGGIEKEVLTNPYAALIVQGILSAAAEHRYNVTLFTIDWDGRDSTAAQFRDGRTDGILIVAPLTDNDMASALSRLGIPIVCVSSESDVPGVPYVKINNEAGARMATEHLLSLGHRRIAHVAGYELHRDAIERREAFLRTMAAAGLSVPANYQPEGTFEPQRAIDRTVRVLTLPQPPTALFACSDTLALAAYDAARSLGLRIPEDISVVGFDDIQMAALAVPGLTTIRQPLTTVGALATSRLIELIDAGSASGSAQADSARAEGARTADGIVLEPALIIRGSTAPPRR